MTALGPLAFLQPWLLLALAALPALWLLLRVTPPAPRRLPFPAIRLLTGLVPPEETPARTPPWLLILRLLAAALLILGLAGPVMHPAAQLSGSGPLVLAVDTGWAAGKGWPQRQEAMTALLDRAERDGRRVVMLTTAPERADTPLSASDPLTPAEARERLMALEPRPWPVDLEAAEAVAAGLDLEGSAHAVWLASGLDAPGSDAFARTLQRLGRLEVLRPEAEAAAMTVLPPERGQRALTVPLRRAAADAEAEATVIASGEDGRLVGSATALFEAGEHETAATFDLPLDLRNRIARVALEGETHAGAVALLDGRWQRRPVGVATAGALDEVQPLLSQSYYLDRALRPFAEITQGRIEALTQESLSLIAMPDRGRLSPERRAALSGFIEDGGVLLRFAGPRMAEGLTGPNALRDGGEPLLPVTLRRGGRALGGAMSWDSPAPLRPFSADSPFAGLEIPEEVTVERQVLADPALDLEDKAWARLADGTPLVTAERRGQGWLVLVHTTANTDWSNLVLSGLFVEMLQRILEMSEGVAAGPDHAALPPQSVLDGFGQPASPGAGVRPIPAEALDEGRVSPAHPPGIYGREGHRRAHNLGPAAGELVPLSGLPSGVEVAGLAMQPETRLGPWLLLAGLVLMLADFLIALGLRGLLPLPGKVKRPQAAGGTATTGAAVLLLSGVMALGGAGSAKADDDFAMKATLDTRLAYVETGDAETDQRTREGLEGLSRTLTRRTSVEPALPLGVDLDRHELAFFPLLYWSITPNQPDLTPTAAEKLSDFMRGGGTLVVDLRESASSGGLGGGTPARRALRRLTRDVELPPLDPVHPDHVVTRTFYLLDEFPGRHSGGTLWVEDTRERAGENVASLIVGSNDWVSAWAVDERGRPRYSVSPGGERQREMANRFGVNLVMYALTGDYKEDQVHVPEILERLGQ